MHSHANPTNWLLAGGMEILLLVATFSKEFEIVKLSVVVTFEEDSCVCVGGVCDAGLGCEMPGRRI